MVTGRLSAREGQQDEGLSCRIVTRTIFIHIVVASDKILMGLSLAVCTAVSQVPTVPYKVP